MKIKRRFVGSFTLVELLVVFAIIMIVAGTATVAVAPFMRGRDIRNGSRAVQTVLRQARSHAARSRKNTSVVFEDGEDGLMEIKVDGERVFEPRYLPEGIEFDEGNPAEIIFTPTGSLKGGTTQIKITNGGSVTITIVGTSGLVREGDVVEGN